MVYNGLVENCKKKLMLHFIIISNKKVILQRKHKQQNMHNTLFLRRHLNVMDVRWTLKQRCIFIMTNKNFWKNVTE